MKKYLIYLCAIAIVIVAVAYFLMPLSTEKDIEIYYGESELFSQDELESAADLVLAQFRNIENCELLRLYYDEAISVSQAED